VLLVKSSQASSVTPDYMDPNSSKYTNHFDTKGGAQSGFNTDPVSFNNKANANTSQKTDVDPSQR